MQVWLPPSPASARAGRAAVSDFLRGLGRADLADNAMLVTAELLANAVMHARTEMSLSIEPEGDGVRVAVTDGSDILPRWTPSSPTATSGRGLLLVAQLSSSWGVDPLPSGGKRVWAEFDAASVETDAGSPDDLLELWSDDPWPAPPVRDAGIEVTIDIDVQAMLDSRAHTEDLVRDLQLTLLDAADAGTTSAATTAVVRLARRLDSANQEFHEARRQIYDQTISAAKRRQTRTTLHLWLHRSDSGRARRWLAALDEADELTAAGTLLLPPFPPDLTAFRRDYIRAIVQELESRT